MDLYLEVHWKLCLCSLYFGIQYNVAEIKIQVYFIRKITTRVVTTSPYILHLQGVVKQKSKCWICLFLILFYAFMRKSQCLHGVIFYLVIISHVMTSKTSRKYTTYQKPITPQICKNEKCKVCR